MTPIDGRRSPKADRYAKRLPGGPIKPPRGGCPLSSTALLIVLLATCRRPPRQQPNPAGEPARAPRRRHVVIRLLTSLASAGRRLGARPTAPGGRSAAPDDRGARRRAAAGSADNGRGRRGAFRYSRYVDELAGSRAPLSGLELAFVDQVAQTAAAQGRPLTAWQRDLLERAFLTDRPLGYPHTDQ